MSDYNTAYDNERQPKIGATPENLEAFAATLPSFIEPLVLDDRVGHYFWSYAMTGPGMNQSDYLRATFRDTHSNLGRRALRIGEAWPPPSFHDGDRAFRAEEALKSVFPDEKSYYLRSSGRVMMIAAGSIDHRIQDFKGTLFHVAFEDESESTIALSYHNYRGRARPNIREQYGMSGPTELMKDAARELKSNPETIIQLLHEIFPNADTSDGELEIVKFIELDLPKPPEAEPQLQYGISEPTREPVVRSKKRKKIFGIF